MTRGTTSCKALVGCDDTNFELEAPRRSSGAHVPFLSLPRIHCYHVNHKFDKNQKSTWGTTTTISRVDDSLPTRLIPPLGLGNLLFPLPFQPRSTRRWLFPRLLGLHRLHRLLGLLGLLRLHSTCQP